MAVAAAVVVGDDYVPPPLPGEDPFVLQHVVVIELMIVSSHLVPVTDVRLDGQPYW